MMTMKEVAAELVAGCRENREGENLDKLYSPDAVSVEAVPMSGSDSAEIHGLDGIKGKHEWWNTNMEYLGGDIKGPFPNGDDKFAVFYSMKAKNRESGEVMEIDEVGVYHVKDGKIVREEFFYDMS